MARWVFRCKNCDFPFTHSNVAESLLSYFEAPKPPMPSEGSEHECPKAQGNLTKLAHRAGLIHSQTMKRQ
jgi:hypothetical protein